MKRFLIIILFLFVKVTFGSGVAIVNASTGQWLRLDSSFVSSKVDGQIAETKVTGFFFNQFGLVGSSVRVKYAFPLPAGASATNLRYRINGEWFTATVTNTQQDTVIPGGGGSINANLKTYLGSGALYVSIPYNIGAGERVAIELTYVEFLPYDFGSVKLNVPVDYHLLQAAPIAYQSFNFELNSQRGIDSCKLVSTQPIYNQTVTTNHCVINSIMESTVASQNFTVVYILSSVNLGLYGYSTKPGLENHPDSLGGYMAFVAEPAYQSTDYIKKYFTLIIDHSGSMYGTKIEQAKQAATYIVNNMNEGDYFNIVKFSTNVTSFQSSHVPFSADTKTDALTFINAIQATDLTNISGAFSTAIPQFVNASDSTANIIVFLTDGLPTVGLTSTESIISHIHTLVTATNNTIYIFPFGIGSDVDKQLLGLIAQNNKGIAQYLGNDEVFASIKSFYNLIRNPVLLSPSVTFTPPVVTDYYPTSLPNLYKGQQLILSGRYTEASPIQVKLKGTAFNNNVEYIYNLALSDSGISTNSFLPKVWAKKKIDDLYSIYLTLAAGSTRADSIKNVVINVSKRYGVISPFTSFVVPVELTSFSANVDGSIVSLKWMTATETNNQRFEIERKSGSEEFKVIASVLGNGTTTNKHTYYYLDGNLKPGKYTYRLKQIDYDGTVTYSGEVTVVVIIPESFNLGQNYPNPFNPSTKIKFEIPMEGSVNLSVYNVLGQLVEVLIDKKLVAGTHDVEFNSKNLASGNYFYVLSFEGLQQVKKLTILK